MGRLSTTECTYLPTSLKRLPRRRSLGTEPFLYLPMFV